MADKIGLFGAIEQTPRDMFNEGDEEGLFRYYRENGFPNYPRESYSVRAELDKIIAANRDDYYSELTKKYTKYPSANGFLFSYFPHWIDVKCGQSESIRNAWNNDQRLRALIKKTVTFCKKHGEDWTENRIRQNAKVYCASQSVSNFNPICAKLIYDEFASGGTVYDMSMGWGGRLLGFYGSTAQRYIGTDPSVRTFLGLQELNTDLARASRVRKSVAMFPFGSEQFSPDPIIGTVDLCFTSPPYYDTEKYSDEPTQSYLAFPNPSCWITGFLGQTMTNCYRLLKADGVLAINIADTQKVKFSDKIIGMAERTGFRYIETRQYEISSVSKTSSKNEPLYVFAKGGATVKRQATLFD